VVFSDDFGGDLSQWTIVSGTWAIEGGELSGTGYRWAHIVAGDTNWNDYVLEAKVKPISEYDGTDGNNHAPGILARYKDNKNYLMLYLRQGGGMITLGRKVANVWETIESAYFVWSNGNWYVLKLKVNGFTAEAYVNDQFLFSASIPTELADGKVGVIAFSSHAHFDDMVVDNPGESSPIISAPEFELGLPVVLSIASTAYMLIKRWIVKKQ
jgi:hypothetical protein